VICAGGALLWFAGRPQAPESVAAGGASAGLPGFVAQPPEAAPAPAPAVPEATRVANLMALWRQSIIVRDPEGVLACDRSFLDEPAVFLQALTESAQKDGEERVRAFSTRVLGKFTDPALAPTFLALLTDESPFVRGNAAWALGQLSPELGREALLKVQRQDRVASVRQSAAEALARLQAPRDQRAP
jgi:hypothetical protein